MKNLKKPVERIKTGVPHLDAILNGGIPKRSAIIFGGNPGSGKTILSQQIGFHNASPSFPVIYFQTLSEPTAKTITYASQFDYFDAAKVGETIHFIDLGDLLRTKGVEQAVALFTENIRRIKPALVVVDSFKAFDDLAQTREELRKFSYEVVINLMAWECTSLLLGEFGPADISSSPLSSVVDGIMILSQEQESGENRRFLQVSKMRGTLHNRDRHTLGISDRGIDVYAPRVTIHRDAKADQAEIKSARLKTGIKTMDTLIKDGIPRGSSCLISGVSGTGKSILALEILYRGAVEYDEKGVLFLFEETRERVIAVATRMGWDLEHEIKRGMLEIIAIPQPSIEVDEHLMLMHERVRKFSAKRVVIDSVSAFLHKVSDPKVAREKVYQLATVVQNVGAVGFFITDVPYGSNQVSRYGVEESVVDGVILLSSEKNGIKRERAIEIYKLRNTTHSDGQFKMKIGKSGISIQA